MTTQYGSGGRAPSAGVVSRAVAGLGKLAPGWHDLEVMSVAEYPHHQVVLLGNSAGHVHAEAVASVPPWLRLGVRVRALVGPGPGFVVVRDVDRYQARDSVTKVPVTDWHTDVGELYQAALAAGTTPATTVLREVKRGDAVWTPVLRGASEPPAPGARGGPAPARDP